MSQMLKSSDAVASATMWNLMKFTRFLSQFAVGFLGCTLVALLFGGCVSGPNAQEREDQETTAAEKHQKQQRQKWLKAKAMWVKEAEKLQVRANQSAPMESWKALLLVKGYPVEVAPIPSMEDVLTLLGPPSKKRSYRDTQGGQVTMYTVWHYPNYKTINPVTGDARAINLVWQTISGQYYLTNLESAE